MANEGFCCAAAAARAIRKLTLLDGDQVAISGLDGILGDVAALRLSDKGAIEKELLERVKASNYVPRCAEDEYGCALLREYEQKYPARRE